MQSTYSRAILPTLATATIIAALSITGAHAGTTAKNVVCKGCVGAVDLANKAVTAAKIKPNSVNFNRLHKTVRNRITELEDKVARLEAALATSLELNDYVKVVMVEREAAGGAKRIVPTVRFEAANVQIVDGTGQTVPAESAGAKGPNGLGNLIIGYDEERGAVGNRTGDGKVCSDGQYLTQADCQNNNATWAEVHKSGTHNLVVGPGHSYSQAGGVVFGVKNATNRNMATVTGGERNNASGLYSSVGGGFGNLASADGSIVSGGEKNTASADFASVSGGNGNTASGFGASVSGGISNTASAEYASVSGGTQNVASSAVSSVSGGKKNEASAIGASVSGGENNEASGRRASISGGEGNTAGGEHASVSGGQDNKASGEWSSVSGGGGNGNGGGGNVASGPWSSISGGADNTASGIVTSISGGGDNRAEGTLSSVSGGGRNRASAQYSTVSGGRSSTVTVP